MTKVVAAIIERDGQLLICQRRAEQPHPLKWEFPGGKVEPDESPKAALRRELNEELGIDVEVGEEFLRYEFAYPGKKPILLIFFAVDSFQGAIENKIFERVQWLEREELAGVDFLDGDAKFLTWFTARR